MVSPRKSSSALSLIPEERGKLLPVSTKSCESLYSNTSSSKGSINNLFHRKHFNGVGVNHGRHATLIPANTEVRQRVLSARRLRIKTFQNQLADAQQTIADLAHENRILRTLHKRQDSALAKYESTNAELPKLLHSHSEELRMWQTKYRNLQQINKEMEHKLKAKESIILTLSDQNKYFSQLNKDRNLEERQRLSEKLEKLETRLQEKDNDMKLFARRVQIETKNFKQQIMTEQKRTKEALLKLEKARLELSGYRKLDEFGENFSTLTVGRRKTNTTEDSKLDKDLERILADDVLDKDEKHEESDFHLASQRSTEPNNLISETPLDYINRKTSSSFITNSKLRKQRQKSCGPRTGNNKEKIQFTQNQTQIPRQQKKSQHREKQTYGRLTALTDYENDYENEQDECQDDNYHNIENGDIELVDDDGDVDNVVDEDDEGEDISGICDSNRKANDEVVSNDTYNAEFFRKEHELQNLNGEVGDNGDDDDDDQSAGCNTAKKTLNMKEEISSIRKQISHDYEEREAFLDTFCRQANSGVLLDETNKKKTNQSPGHNLPSSRKNKLLAALKAIDDKNHN